LVGGKAIDLLNSPTLAADWPRFLVDRFSRIFIVLWPALVLSGTILLVLHLMAPNAPFMISPRWGWAMDRPLKEDATMGAWLSAAALLNGLGSLTLQIDSPIWSLAYEWFYYMSALAIVLVARRVFSTGAMLVIGYAVVLLVLGLLFNQNMIWLALVWGLGVIAKMAFDRRLISGHRLRLGSVLVLLAVLVVDRLVAVPDFFIGLIVAVVIAHRDWAEWRFGATWGEQLAAFSYSLYLTHFPITIAALGVLYQFDGMQKRLPLDTKGLIVAAVTVAFAICFARIFALATEDRTRVIRNLLIRRTGRVFRSPTEAQSN